MVSKKLFLNLINYLLRRVVSKKLFLDLENYLLFQFSVGERTCRLVLDPDSEIHCVSSRSPFSLLPDLCPGKLLALPDCYRGMWFPKVVFGP